MKRTTSVNCAKILYYYDRHVHNQHTHTHPYNTHTRTQIFTDIHRHPYILIDSEDTLHSLSTHNRCMNDHHIHTHTHTMSYIHTYIQYRTCTHSYTHTYIYTHTHTHTHCIREKGRIVHVHDGDDIPRARCPNHPTHTRIHTHTYTHTMSYTHIQTHTHTHNIHICIYI